MRDRAGKANVYYVIYFVFDVIMRGHRRSGNYAKVVPRGKLALGIGLEALIA